MYKIIGADHQEYGPSSAEELRQWVREGRADGQSLVRLDGTPEWKPLASFPELASALPQSPLTAPLPFGSAGPADSAEDIAARDWDLDIGSCISRSWTLLQQQFWPVVGVSLVVWITMGAVNEVINLASHSSMEELQKGQFSWTALSIVSLTSLIAMPFQTLFIGGLSRYFLKLVRGEPAEFGDAFSGFSVAPIQLLSLGLIQNILIVVGLCFCILPGIYLGIAWSFSILLVVDRRMDFWPAMELSRRVVSKHWFIILGLVLLNGLISISGIVACCVGVFITAPIGLGSLVFAYDDLFGRRAGPPA